MTVGPLRPCYTAHLFRPLLGELVTTLRALNPDDRQRQTLAPRWRVRDVAYAARLSPRLITDLLEVAGTWAADVIEALPPHGRAVFGVSWAGEAESENWMDTGREYTEWWHHQMQIRAATGRPLLLEPEWMAPLLDLSVRALPHAYRAVEAAEGSALVVHVTGPTEGAWTLRRDDPGWRVFAGAAPDAGAVVRIRADAAWRLLYNAPYEPGAVTIEGDAALAAPLLKARSVIV